MTGYVTKAKSVPSSVNVVLTEGFLTGNCLIRDVTCDLGIVAYGFVAPRVILIPVSSV